MLFKSVFRHFTRRLLQVFLLGIIIVLSAFIYVVMDYSIGSVKEPTEEFFQEYHQEDFNVTMLGQLLAEDYLVLDASLQDTVQTLTELYRVDVDGFMTVMNRRIEDFQTAFPQTTLEPRMLKDVYLTFEGTQHTLRFVKDAKEINLSYIHQGVKPSATNEIALTQYYADVHNIAIGDEITLGEHRYFVTGFVLFPDYSLPMFGNEFIINNKTRTLVLSNDEQFNQLEGNFEVILAGEFTEEVTKRTYFNDYSLDFILHIALTENTIRSGAIYDELAGGQAMGIMMGLIIAAMAVFVVAIMVSRMLNEQRGAIGVLKALGYRNSEITLPYMFFILLIALPGLLIGYYLGYLAAEPMKKLYMSIYLLPDVPIEHSLSVFVTSIVLPMVILLGLGYIVVMRLLSANPITLMSPPLQKPAKPMKIMRKSFKKMKLIARLKHAYIWRNPTRFAVFLMGVFTAVFLILLSLSMTGFMDKLVKDYYDQIDVRYIGYCDPIQGCDVETVEVDRVLEIPYVMLNDSNVTIVGLDSATEFHPLFENGKEITHLLDQEGIIITKSLSMESRLKVGDLVDLSYGNDAINVEIIGIQDEYSASKVYINRTAASLYLSKGQSMDLYTTVYSYEPLQAEYAYVIVIDDLIAQTEDLTQLAAVMTYALIVVSFILGMIVMMLISILALEAYFYDICLFKVIGYYDKEIQKVFIDGYRFYAFIIFIVSVPLALLVFEVMMWYLATQYGMTFPMTLTIPQMGIALGLTLLIFYVSVPIAKAKLTKLSLQQSLKIYQM